MIWLKRKNKANLKDSFTTDVDIDNLLSSFGHIEDMDTLYKSLCSRCHPDRFVGNEIMQQKATDLFQRIQNCRFNYNALKEIEKEANEIVR